MRKKESWPYFLLKLTLLLIVLVGLGALIFVIAVDFTFDIGMGAASPNASPGVAKFHFLILTGVVLFLVAIWLGILRLYLSSYLHPRKVHELIVYL